MMNVSFLAFSASLLFPFVLASFLSPLSFRFVVNSKSSSKCRGIELLVRLLLEMQRSPPRVPPDFNKLKPLATQMVGKQEEVDEDNQ